MEVGTGFGQAFWGLVRWVVASQYGRLYGNPRSLRAVVALAVDHLVVKALCAQSKAKLLVNAVSGSFAVTLQAVCLPGHIQAHQQVHIHLWLAGKGLCPQAVVVEIVCAVSGGQDSGGV